MLTQLRSIRFSPTPPNVHPHYSHMVPSLFIIRYPQVFTGWQRIWYRPGLKTAVRQMEQNLSQNIYDDSVTHLWFGLLDRDTFLLQPVQTEVLFENVCYQDTLDC